MSNRSWRSGTARPYRGKRTKKLEPKSWWVFHAPKKIEPHKHLVGIPCVDWKRPIWAGDVLFRIEGSGHVRDVRGRMLHRQREFLVCQECTDLRHQCYKERRRWPDVNSKDVVEWLAKAVEGTLETLDLVDREV